MMKLAVTRAFLRVQRSTKPSQAGKRIAIRTNVRHSNQAGGAASDSVDSAAHLRSVERLVIGQPASLLSPSSPSPLPSASTAAMEQDWVVEHTWQLHRQHRFLAKRAELERMRHKMEAACLELERTDLRRFQLAMLPLTGDGQVALMPLERRFPTDTPPLLDNAVSQPSSAQSTY